MAIYLGIQNTYNSVEIALFQDSNLLECVCEDKTRASKNFFLMLQALLKKHHIKLQEISFIAVNQGPGPFTTLRVVIASVNGLSFATEIPLIGIDALDAFLLEQNNKKFPYTIALLNAFSNDIYFGIQRLESPHFEKGYENIDVFLEHLRHSIAEQDVVRFIGNGTQLYEQKIKNVFGEQAFIPDPLPQTCSVQQIAKMGLEKWQKKEGLSEELMPLYLKQTSAVIYIK